MDWYLAGLVCYFSALQGGGKFVCEQISPIVIYDHNIICVTIYSSTKTAPNFPLPCH